MKTSLTKMFNLNQDCVLINCHNCCYKSIDTQSKELSNAATNDLFICHVNIISLSKNIDRFKNFQTNLQEKLTLFALAKLG